MSPHVMMKPPAVFWSSFYSPRRLWISFCPGDLVNSRCQKGPMILTWNRGFGEWDRVFDLPPAAALGGSVVL